MTRARPRTPLTHTYTALRHLKCARLLVLPVSSFSLGRCVQASELQALTRGWLVVDIRIARRTATAGSLALRSASEAWKACQSFKSKRMLAPGKAWKLEVRAAVRAGVLPGTSLVLRSLRLRLELSSELTDSEPRGGAWGATACREAAP